MPNCNSSKIFKKSCIAAAVLSLSACSSAPRIDDFDAGRLGDNLAQAGKSTLDAGIKVGRGAVDISYRVLDETAYWLGFGEDRVNTDQVPVDEVDLAMLEEDAVLPAGEITQIRPVTVDSAIVIAGTDTDNTSMSFPIAGDAVAATDIDASAIIVPGSETVSDIDVATATDALSTATDNASSSVELVATSDRIHEVSKSETLWDIAKATTGDANNWHIIADINNLAPNAAVYPGMQLTIPADMLKPALNTLPADTQVAVAANTAADTATDTAPGTENGRLKIPTDNNASSDDLLVSDSSSVQVGAPVSDPASDAVQFKIESGETLWDFAKRTTGDATNWKNIASQNGFSDDQAVKVWAGQKVYVPDALVKATLTDESAATVEVASVDAAPALDAESIEATTAVLAGTNMLDETQPIKIVEATFKTDPTATQISEELLAEDAQKLLNDPSMPADVMVSGTYYPKAIYNNADFSSSLLMRVSPGTTLQVSRAMGPWFEVETDKGTGYVHQRDVK